MVADARGRETKDLVGDGASFDGDVTGAAELEEVRVVLRQGERVADALCRKEDGVVEVLGGGSLEGLAGVEDEREVETERVAAGAEVEELLDPVEV